MRFALHDHQRKGQPLAMALVKQGWQPTTNSPEVLIVDHDGPEYYRRMIKQYVAQGTQVVLYSHGAMSCMAWDGWWPANENTRAYLSIGSGQKAVMQAYDYPNPIHVIGWYWCKQKPFKPAGDLKRVLFAPIHPLNNGFMRPDAKAANTQAYATLVQLGLPISVRIIGSPEQNGLWPVTGVEFHGAHEVPLLTDIADADLVVSWGTLAHIAVARGKPTIMYGQDDVPGNGHNIDEMRYVENWDKYRDILYYPLDLFRENPERTIGVALKSDKLISDWRKRFIGRQLSPKRLSNTLEKILTNA